MTKISKLLIANRGEIACRIMRTAHKMGIDTVAVYSDADQDAPHRKMATEAIYIGPSPAMESYLAIEKIIAAALTSNVDAIHPGYGFLSENADFAEACSAAELIFIGPSARAITLMGNKAEAKRQMTAAGVPCVPGYEGEDQTDIMFANAAEDIGYPVMVKASAGGGGRGMRIITKPEKLMKGLVSARSEAERSFGSGELILEKAILEPRHIEIQVFADNHGNVVHLGERDCSIQRRHQKVIEEAPSPAVSSELRERMGETAIAATRAINYSGAGTFEFLLDQHQKFFFLEMNTRLQVEHPVTECVTGQDLVEWQIKIAAGDPLPVSQEDIRIQGHAIEARLYSEDPYKGFMPKVGVLSNWVAAEGEGIRTDHGLETGFEVTPFYDGMIAKIIGYGVDRETARSNLLAGLKATVDDGLTTNRQFLLSCVVHDAFKEGLATTGFIETFFPKKKLAEGPEEVLALDK
jgi:geranyl-CoA carboxylase alpha subunit